jgi:hypothetical protein
MASSGAAAQAELGYRDAQSQAASVTLVMMMVVAVIMAAVMSAWLAAHGGPAGRAELRRLGFHAGCDLGDVGDNIGAKSHRIWRARLAGGVAALGRRTINVSKE